MEGDELVVEAYYEMTEEEVPNSDDNDTNCNEDPEYHELYD